MTLWTDNRTVVSLPFGERHDAVLPSDRAGSLEDLRADPDAVPPLALPPVTDGVIGRARSFGAGRGFVGVERVPDATRLTRDVTVEAVVRGTGTIVARGRGGSAAERRLFHVALEANAPGLVRLVASWDHGATDRARIESEPFELDPTAFVYVWWSRRWVSASEVEVVFGTGDRVISAHTSVAGDIDGGVGGAVTVGCLGDGAGSYASFFEGVIDAVRISSAVRSAEELAQVHLALFVQPAEGYQSLRALMPVGDRVYSDDPDSVVQRELRVEGAAFGVVQGALSELRDDFFPDRAWSKLPDWERVTRQASRASDSIATRRARVQSFLRTQHGYSVAKVKHALEPTFAVPAERIELLEFTNLYDTAMSGDVAPFWSDAPGAGAIAEEPTGARLSLPAGADGRWEASGAVVRRQPVDGDVVFDADPTRGVHAVVSLASRALPSALSAGLIAYHGASGELLVFGVVNAFGTELLYVGRYHRGAWEPATVLALDVPADEVLELQARYDGAGRWTCIASGSSLGSLDPVTVDGPPADWIGVGLLSDSVAATPADSSAVFANWRALAPNGDRVYNWFAYRDPALPGIADMVGANAVVRRLRPAHTHGHAVQSRALACDDPLAGGCDAGPLGA